jgi:predicted short-subunit dehydrogenase-like oxidoreductase (DUF2520 family)
MSDSFSRIVVLGYGNVGSHLVEWLKKHHMKPVQVFSPSFSGVRKKLLFVSELSELLPDADLYILALPDDAVAGVLEQLNPGNGLWVHCSAALGLDVFPAAFNRTGVFYPLQTFSKGVEMSYDLIPLLVEANSPEDLKDLRKLASQLSTSVSNCDHETRLKLHVAAVFTSNFCNHLLRLSSDYLKAEGLDFELLEPLVIQTMSKVIDSGPHISQTGPALRRDYGTMEKHHARLSDYPELQNLYKLLSDSIMSHNPNGNVEL